MLILVLMVSSDGVPSSMAGKALLLVTEWARNRRLNEAQKKALKTLVLTQNSVWPSLRALLIP